MQACLACTGSILFTGVGKSGFIAQKISQTLISTGTRAMYLNPTDALHGDLGIVSPDDLVVLFSKSGNTEELVRLVPFAKANPSVSTTCQDALCSNLETGPPCLWPFTI
jgi:arabinose-5-phosphate isomerase